ncbi:hypothetical protein BDV93DRAFT_610081 [Ceratobasidium sp. AG-I]|nr:hypothetical protein BDV93DRAFT_610081 [Ceratobasidium sp. AG-I]
MGGWKNRIPAVSYFILDSGIEEYGFAETRYLEPGLVGIPHSMTIDASRKLLLVGDKKRVKSYAWASPSGEFYPDKPLPTHTLDSADFIGAMTVLPNGTIVRAGDGEAAVWDINSLPTHGPKGKRRIGNRINIQNVWRDDPEAIERSSGSVPTSRIKFVDQPTLSPGTWESLPQAPSTMICSTRCGSTPEYWCLSIDLAHGGKTVARYIGHGGIMGDLSVSDGDPNVFLTGCTDGFARLFDVRRPLPVCTFDVCARREACNSVALGHPDGIPIAFTGTGKTQHVTAWDIRARAAIYELSTGNNEVNALAWDPKRNTLFAATECSYMDTAGFRHGYRPGTKCEMNLGKPSTQNQNRKHEEEEEEDGDDDDDYERCWPDLAWHFEDYYEYPFDSGNHRVFRYAFKENPDTSILPEYGDVRVGESFWD